MRRSPEGGGGVNGVILVPKDALSSQGDRLKSGYNDSNGDLSIYRNTGDNRTQFIMSDNGHFYRVLNGSVFAIFDQGTLPWGGESITSILAEWMTNCTSYELDNCKIMTRCGIAFVTLSGITIEKNTTGQITLPIASRFRIEATLIDISTKRSTLAYIDPGSSTINIYPNTEGIPGGYVTMVIPLNM